MTNFLQVVLIAFAANFIPYLGFENVLVHSFTSRYFTSCPRYGIKKVAQMPLLSKATAKAEAEAGAGNESNIIPLEIDKNGIYNLKGKDDHM